MAKGKGKQSTGANSVPVKNDTTARPSSDGALPQLEESAFAGLRQKIEQRLKDGAAKQKSKNNKSKTTPSGDTNNAKGGAIKSDSKSKSPSDRNVKGKKRDRNGDVIENKDSEKSKSDKIDDNDTLRQEILALGGTEEDFDLLAGVDSESEVEDAKPSKKSQGSAEDLRKELSSILAAAGQVVPDDLADDEVEEVEDEEEEEEEEDEDGEGEEADQAESAEEQSSPEDESEDETSQQVNQPAKKEVRSRLLFGYCAVQMMFAYSTYLLLQSLYGHETRITNA